MTIQIFSTPRLRLAHGFAYMMDEKLPYFKGIQRVRNSITRAISPAMQQRCVIKTRYGFNVVVNSIDDHIDQHLYTRGTYEAGTLSVLRTYLSPGDTFIDVGANIGLMSLFAAQRVGNSGKVYAFEPEPQTFRFFMENIEVNQLTNVHGFNMGLSTSDGQAKIYITNDTNRGMASLVKHDHRTTLSSEITVTSLDTFLAAHAVTHIKMMKVDVEGWELNVLKGAQQMLRTAQAPILCIEYNPQAPDAAALFNYIVNINEYNVFILPHGTGRPAKLQPIKTAQELPTSGGTNLFCFLDSQIVHNN